MKKKILVSVVNISVYKVAIFLQKKVAEAEEDTGNGFFPLEIMTLI